MSGMFPVGPAYLLKEQGYDVISHDGERSGSRKTPAAAEHEGGCCGMSAVEDARRVAAQLTWPWLCTNFQDDFQKYVIDILLR